jgi:DNA replication protein DnaC
MPDVLETDNHTTHIYTHMMVQPKTWSTWMHIEWHKELLAQQKAQEQQQQQMMMQEQMQGPPQGQMNKVKVGAERQSPKEQASPLKTEIKNQPQIK